MKFKAEIKQVLAGFRARKGRTFLTMLGIIIGVSGVILIVSLGAGAQALVLGQVTKLGTNLIAVLPGKSNESGPPASVFGVEIKTLTMRDVEAIKDSSRAPGITAVYPYVRGSATVIAGRESIDTNFTGTSGEYPLVTNVPLQDGRFFTLEEGQAGANVAVLGYTVARDLFGEQTPVGKTIKLVSTRNEETISVPLRVVGVAEEQGTVGFQNQDDQIYIPLPIGQRQLLGISHLHAIQAKVSDTTLVKPTIEDVRTILREEHRIKNPPDGDDFSVRDLADAVKLLTSITDVLRVFLGVMAGIALLVGGIGIMNIMLVTVSERTREIGLRKAIGATPRNILNQFLLESVILTFTGGVIGIILGACVSYLVSVGAQYAGYDWKFIISPGSIILAAGVSVVTGIVFGMYPARKAAKLDPIVALRHE